MIKQHFIRLNDYRIKTAIIIRELYNCRRAVPEEVDSTDLSRSNLELEVLEKPPNTSSVASFHTDNDPSFVVQLKNEPQPT